MRLQNAGRVKNYRSFSNGVDVHLSRERATIGSGGGGRSGKMMEGAHFVDLVGENDQPRLRLSKSPRPPLFVFHLSVLFEHGGGGGGVWNIPGVSREDWLGRLFCREITFHH